MTFPVNEKRSLPEPGAGMSNAKGKTVTADASSQACCADCCPDCGQADLEPYGSKWRCPQCGFLEPCCTTDCPARLT